MPIETKPPIMKGLEVSQASVQILAKLVPKLEFDSALIEKELDSGYAQATQVADALALAGVPFREAHGLSGKLVGECAKAGIPLSAAPPIPPLNAKAWAAATSNERPKMKMKLALDGSAKKFIENEKKKIETAYKQLIG